MAAAVQVVEPERGAAALQYPVMMGKLGASVELGVLQGLVAVAAAAVQAALRLRLAAPRR